MVPPNFWIWSLATYTFVEVHFWAVAWDIVAAVLFGKYFEPLWSGIEVIRFFTIVSVLSAILTTATYLFIYLVIRDTDLLFENHVHGLGAFIAAFTVAVKQMEPDAVLFTSAPLGKLRRRHVPLSLLGIIVVLRIVGAVEPSFPILFAWGSIVSWVYLRFYQMHTGGRRGDMADSFSFASFFPEAIQPFIAILSNSFYALLVSAKVCSKVTKKYEVTPQTPVIVTLPGTGIQDAERRRQLALKALNERLSRVPAAAAWPAMEDDDATALTDAGPVSSTMATPLQVATSLRNDESALKVIEPAAISPVSSSVSDSASSL
jgi:hypothetical protein